MPDHIWMQFNKLLSIKCLFYYWNGLSKGKNHYEIGYIKVINHAVVQIRPANRPLRLITCHQKNPPINWIESWHRLAVTGKRETRATVEWRWRCIPGCAAAARESSTAKIFGSWRFIIETTIMTTTHPMVATGSYYAFIAMTTNIHATLIQNIPVPQPKLRRAPLRITRLRIWEIYSRARSKVSDSKRKKKKKRREKKGSSIILTANDIWTSMPRCQGQ